MKEIKVKIVAQENDSYNEVWKVIGEKRYFARHTAYGGEWFFVCDPFGYCELDHSCPDDYVFIVCDAEGAELFRSCNKDESRLFPPLRVLARQEYAKYASEHPNKSAVQEADDSTELYAMAFFGRSCRTCSEWLLGFKDPELYGSEACDYDENWVYCKCEEISRKVLSVFTYAGDEYAIEQVDYRHKVCGKTWSEIYSAGWLMSSMFDQSDIGTVIPERYALKLVEEAVIKQYGAKRLSAVALEMENAVCEVIVSAYDVAKKAIAGDYRRKNIERLLRDGVSGFFSSANEMEKAFSNKAVYKDYSI